MLEIYLRSVNYNPLGKMLDAPAFAPLLRPSTMPERVYEATPNTSGFAWETDISINSLGFRGREYSQHKPNNSYRIIVLGDSIAFGNSLALENTFPHRLEQLFASALPANQVEVLNLALSGYDTLQEIATLAEVGIALEPDMVVLSECINDIGIASGDLIYIKRLQTYGSPIYRLRAAQFIRLLFDRIYLKRAMQKNNVNENFYLKYLNYIVDIESDDSVVPIMQELAYKTQDWNDYFEMVDHYSNKDYLGRLRYSLEWLQRIQNQHGFPVLVFMVPYLHEDIDGANTLYRSIYDIAEHEARRLGYSWLDLYQPFKQAGFEKIQRSNAIDGIHPNATGHEIIAEQLFKLTLPIIEQYFSNRD
jgi:lysophospholipase L1-like esterase